MVTKMPRAIVDLDEFVESNNIMVYGDTGAGKTELVAQLPGKVLIVSSENGTIVIRKALARMGLGKAAIAKEMKRFKVWRIRSWNDLEECYKWCRDHQDVFDWIAIDSATSLDQRAMRAAMEVAVKRNPEKRDIDLPDRGEHQKRQNAMKRMIGDFNELSTNVLWLAQAMRREDQDGNEIVVPFITGKDYEVSAFACAQMQAFGYYMKKRSKTKGQTDRVLIWESFADKDSGINYWSKDRYDVFPKVCVMVKAGEQSMTFSELLDLITPEALSGAAEKVQTYDGEDDPDLEDDEPAEDEDEQDDEPTEYQSRQAELLALKPTQLKVAVEAAGLKVSDFKGQPMADIVDAVLAVEFADEQPEPEEPDEEEPEDDDPTDLGDFMDEMEAREQELLAMKPLQLKEAVEAAGLKVSDFKGKPMAEIVAAVMGVEWADAGEHADNPGDDEESDEDEDDLDLDEMMEDDDEEPEPEPVRRPAKKAAPVKPAAKKAVPAKKTATVTPIRKTAKRIRAN